MAMLRIATFGYQNTMADLLSELPGAFCWRHAEATQFTTPGLNGVGRAINLVAGFFGSRLYGVLTTPLEEAFIGAQLKLNNSGADAWLVLWQSPQSGNPVQAAQNQINLKMDGTNGQISLYRGTTLLAQTGNNAFVINTPFTLEVHAKINAATGLIEVHKDGAEILTFSGNTSQNGNALFDTIGFHLAGTSHILTVDHLWIEDIAVGAGPFPFNTFLGPTTAYVRFVNGAGDSADYTPLSGTNQSQVDETAMDGDTSYNFSETVGDQDLFQIEDLPVGVEPVCVQVTVAARQDAGGTRAAATLLKSNATVATGDSHTLSTGYAYQHDVVPADPDGDIAWTKAAVDAAQIGYETTN